MVNNGVEDLPRRLTDCSGSPLNSKSVWETPPKVLSKVEWTPGEQFRKAGLHEGYVVLSFEVGLDGLAHGVNVVNGLGKGIDERAIDAIEKWRFVARKCCHRFVWNWQFTSRLRD